MANKKAEFPGKLTILRQKAASNTRFKIWIDGVLRITLLIKWHQLNDFHLRQFLITLTNVVYSFAFTVFTVQLF